MAVGMLLRHLKYIWASFLVRFQVVLDYAVATAGPLYIVLAFSLISTVTYLFFTTVLPAVHNVYSFQGIVHILISFWLIFNVFFNYFLCIGTDPGTSPADFGPGVGLSEHDTLTSQIRWCKRCRKAKPPMTHHCHICKRCILKMDHHCPWMHNCIGFYNYRYFFLFLVYMWAGCVYTTLMASIPLFRSSNVLSFSQAADEFTFMEPGEVNGLIFTFVLALAVLASLSCLLGWHIYLVLTAQTTIDFYANRQRQKEANRSGYVWVNQFNMGKVQNFRHVFDHGGRYFWLVFLLPSRRLPRGDGTSFPTQNSYLDLPNLSNGSIQPHYQHEYYHTANSSTNMSVANGSGMTLAMAMAEDPFGDPDMV